MRYAVDLDSKKVYKIDAGMQCMVDAEGIYDPEEADQFVLNELGADVIVDDASSPEEALKEAAMFEQHIDMTIASSGK